ncbi:breast carcinoma-amplified sequence 1 isoform X1, partial [Tachysurus ichikawai]
MSEDITQNASDDNTEITVEGEDLKNETDCPEYNEEETWVIIEDPVCAGDSEEYTQLLCQLKSVCIQTVGDFFCNPVSVNIHSKRRFIEITIDICSSTESETKSRDEARDMGAADVRPTAEDEQLKSEIPDDDNVWISEPADIKTSTQAEKVPQGEAPKTSTTEVTQDTNQPEQSSNEEKTVMNFFKKTF